MTTLWIVSDCDPVAFGGEFHCTHDVYLELTHTLFWVVKVTKFVKIANYYSLEEAEKLAKEIKEKGLHDELKTGYIDRKDWSIVELSKE